MGTPPVADRVELQDGADTRPAPVDFESEVAFGMVAFCLKRSILGEKLQKDGVRDDEDVAHPILLESLKSLRCC